MNASDFFCINPLKPDFRPRCSDGLTAELALLSVTASMLNVKCVHTHFFPLLSPKGALTECYDELGNRYQLPVYCLAPPINMIEEKGDLETLDIPDPPPNSGHECQLRLRLSTGKDLKLMVRSMDTVYHMKRRLHAVEGVEPGSQRWFFSGRPLADKMKLEELKIPKDYVVQVIVSQPLANPTPVEN